MSAEQATTLELSKLTEAVEFPDTRSQDTAAKVAEVLGLRPQKRHKTAAVFSKFAVTLTPG